MPNGAAVNSNCCDFANQKDSPSTQTHQVIAKLRGPEILFRKRLPPIIQFGIKSSGSRHGKRRILVMRSVYFYQKYAEKRILNGNRMASL